MTPTFRGLSLCLAALAVVFSPVDAVALDDRVLTPAAAVELAISSAADGMPVMIQGEAIGEALMAPGNMRWVNILGGGTAIGVVVDARTAESIPSFGEYRQRGATVLVSGTLQSACDEHGGDLDVHATSFRIIDDGEAREHVIDPAKPVLAVGAIAVALALAWLYRRRRRRSFVI